MTKSSSSIWRCVVSVKSMVKISSIFVAFLENRNFNERSNVMKYIVRIYLTFKLTGMLTVIFFISTSILPWNREVFLNMLIYVHAIVLLMSILVKNVSCNYREMAKLKVQVSTTLAKLHQIQQYRPSPFNQILSCFYPDIICLYPVFILIF